MIFHLIVFFFYSNALSFTYFSELFVQFLSLLIFLWLWDDIQVLLNDKLMHISAYQGQLNMLKMHLF